MNPHFRWRTRPMLLTLFLVAGLGACAADDSSVVAGGRPMSSQSPASPEAKVPAQERPKDALAPKQPQVVLRSGKTPKPKYSSGPATFAIPAQYKDRLKVEVVDITQGTVEGEGPGVFAGDPKTTFRLRFENNTAEPIELDQVVVDATYGDPARVARPTYGETARDFHGAVTPGSTAEATYAFSIPTSELDSVRLRVDFDGLHAPATFSGEARS